MLFKGFDAMNVVYAQGYLLFLRETTLMAQPFDLRRLALAGDPVPIAERIQTTPPSPSPLAIFSASENGVLAYQTGTEVPGSQFVWLDRQAKLADDLGGRDEHSDLTRPG